MTSAAIIGSVDQNLVAAQWGLLVVFGVVVALLIPQATRRRRAYLRVGTPPTYASACAWERSIKRLAWTVLGAVVVLGLVGLYDAGVVSIVPLARAIASSESRWLWFVVDSERSRIATWLLLAAAPLAQGACLGLVVFRVVWPVPPLETLTLEPAEAMRPSASGNPPRTVIYLANETPTALTVEWIDSRGGLRPFAPIPPGQGRSQPTFVGHRWQLTRSDGWVRTVTAVDNPGWVVIK
jgi:hypothetical protein